MEYGPHEDDHSFQPIGLAANRVVLNLIDLCKFSEMRNRACVVSAGGIEGITECAKMKLASVNHQAGDKAARFIYVNALQSALGWRSALVRIVLLTTRLSEIGDSVVTATAINVVHQSDGPVSVDIKPRQPRSAVERTVNPDQSVSLDCAQASGARSDKIGTMPDPAIEVTSEGVVSHNLPETRCGQRPVGELVGHSSNPSEKQQGAKPSSGGAHQDKSNGQKEYVARRLEDFARFERRALGTN